MKSKALLFIILLLCVASVGTAQKGAEKKPETSLSAVNLPTVNLPPDVLTLLKESRWPEAIEKLTVLYESTVGDPNLKFYLAFCYEQAAETAFHDKKFSAAVGLLESAVQYVNNNAALFIGLGSCYFSLSQYSNALNAFQQVEQLEPDNFQAQRMLGEIYYLTNEPLQAQEHWEKALKLKPKDRYIQKRLKQLTKLLTMSASMETETDMMFSVSFNGTQKPELRELVLTMLSDISLRIGQQLQLYPSRQIPVILLTNEAFFDITDSPQWAGGIYEGHIKIPVDNYDTGRLKIVLTHEYVHAVLFDRLSYRCPWWLNEGLAQFLSGDDAGNSNKLNLAQMFIKQANVPPLQNLPGDLLTKGDKKNVALAYALALSAVHYFIDYAGLSDLQYAMDLMSEGNSFAAVIPDIIGFTFAEFQQKWMSVNR